MKTRLIDQPTPQQWQIQHSPQNLEPISYDQFKKERKKEKKGKKG